MRGPLLYRRRNYLVYGEDYTVSAPNGSGGMLTIITPLPDEASHLTIVRATPKTQEYDLHNGSKLSAELLETMTDKTIMLMQELSEQKVELDADSSLLENIVEEVDNILDQELDERLKLKADIDSPSFTGTPTIPPKAGSPTESSTSIASEAQVKLVKDQIEAQVEDVNHRQSALVNMFYTKGYWFGRRYESTPWPLPETSWPANTIKAFDFSTNMIWLWDGQEWVPGDEMPVTNGLTIGISSEFLDIADSGYPGMAIYSAQTESWDFFPDKYNLEALKKSLIMPGVFEYSATNDAAVLAQWRRMPADGRTIPVNDSRAERLLQYFLIPHEVAVADPDLIGLYLTDVYCPDHAAWLAWCQENPTQTRLPPVENGAYLVIPDGCGIYMRGAGVHGGRKTGDDPLSPPYDGGQVGGFMGDASRPIEGSFGRIVNANITPVSGAFKLIGGNDGGVFSGTTVANYLRNIGFDTSLVVPTAPENRSASVSWFPVISF